MVSSAFSLDVDEKLTLRILKVSQSRKTMLINRGAEDGLNEGDHAKFFLSIGVVSRGVLVKLSPTRSVWSVYRIVNSQYITDDTVMKLKITPAIKLTKDNSRMVVEEDISNSTTDANPRDLGIPLSSSADDLEEGELFTKKAEVSNWDMAPDISEHKFEVLSVLSLNIMNSEATPDKTSIKSFTDGENTTHLLFGFEYYFEPDGKLGRISLQGFYRLQNNKLIGYQGATLTESVNILGAALNYHLLKYPRFASVFLPYIQLGFGVGGVTGQYAPGTENGAQNPPVQDISGSASAFHVGAGVKYVFRNNFGVRFQMDYQSTSITFEEETLTNTVWSKTKAGVVSFMGLSYRF